MQAAQSSSLTRSQLTAHGSQLSPSVRQQPGKSNPTIPDWLMPIAVTGTAAVLTAVTLSAYDTGLQWDNAQPPAPADPQPDQAQQPVQADSQSCSTVCRDLNHVQTQMATLRRYLSERQVALQSLQAQYTISDPQAAAQAIAQRLRSAEIQQERLEWEANTLQRDLQQLNVQLGMHVQLSVVDILNQNPDYQQQWQQWQQIDRQVGAASEAAALGSPVWNPKEHDQIAPTVSQDVLLTQHKQVSDQLQATIAEMTQQPAQRLSPHFEQAIKENPLRLAYVEPWITKAHRLQMVQGRQQTLQLLAQTLQQQQQDWLRLAQREAFLKADIVQAKEAIEAYAVQVRRLQNHLHGDQHLVAPPDAIIAR